MAEDRVHTRLVYDAGVRARTEGKTHLDNPHRNDTDNHVTWFLGWRGEGHPSVDRSRERTS